eukprot:TRINITY_DN2562_c0_g2_i1.p1 TRINITY_DN2562_c0_g2~~TRINITY_DN2562_c0_g2_i1.p1  ORF type:complete len:277 (+),score=59.61 TRINITY_DN2562_c0_g2_i1:57-887(+)
MLLALTCTALATLPVYQIQENRNIEPCSVPPYTAHVQSWKECQDALLQLRPTVATVVNSPSMALGRTFNRGCYFYPKRLREYLQAGYWNEVTRNVKINYVGGSGAGVCKHEVPASIADEMVPNELKRTLREKLPTSKLVRRANVSVILVTKREDVTQVMDGITKQKKTFSAMSEKFSKLDTATGGAVGFVYEGTLEPNVNDAIFSGKAPLVVENLFGGVQTNAGYFVILVHELGPEIDLSEAAREDEKLNDEVALNGVYISYGLSRPAMLRDQEEL